MAPIFLSWTSAYQLDLNKRQFYSLLGTDVGHFSMWQCKHFSWMLCKCNSSQFAHISSICTERDFFFNLLCIKIRNNKQCSFSWTTHMQRMNNDIWFFLQVRTGFFFLSFSDNIFQCTDTFWYQINITAVWCTDYREIKVNVTILIKGHCSVEKKENIYFSGEWRTYLWNIL